MKLILNQSTLLNSDNLTFLEAAKEAGFDGIEWRIEKVIDLPGRELTKIRVVAEGEGIASLALHSFKADELLAAGDNYLNIAKRIGCQSIVIISGTEPIHGSDFKKIVQKASGYDVRVLFEPLGFHWCKTRTMEEAKELLINISGLGNVGLVLDSFHAYLSYEGFSDLAKLDFEKVRLIHVSNVKEERPRDTLRDWDRTLPADGAVDLRPFFEVLKAKSYRGPISVEAFSKDLCTEDPFDVAKRAKKQLEALLRSVGFR